MTQRHDQPDPDGVEVADEPQLTGPNRLCALTRTPHPIADLIRFGAGLDGVVVPDLALRLPGRGVWIALDRSSVEQAVRRNVFAKSLKRAVTPPSDLPARIDALLQKRVLEALSLANKAGQVVPGFAKIDAALEQGQVVGLFHGSDGATDGVERLDRKFRAITAANKTAANEIDRELSGPATPEEETIPDRVSLNEEIPPRRTGMSPIVSELTIDQISLAIGRSNVVHAAIISGGAAARLMDEARRLQRYRASPAVS